MIPKNLAILLAFATATSAAPALRRQNDCQDAYKQCVANGTPEVSCSCTLTACLGEDSARLREWCASATASLAQPAATFTSIAGIPGGCNPAHPGSCPSSYFDKTQSAAPTFTSIAGIPGGCNPAHPGSCPSSYFTYTTETATAAPTFTSIAGIPGGCNPAHPGSCPSSYFDKTQSAAPTFTSIAGIPGGCNPAHPGSCPSSYFDKTQSAAPTFTSIAGIPGGCNPAHPGSCPSSYFTTSVVPAATAAPAQPQQPAAEQPAAAQPGVVYPDPKPVSGKTWTVSDLSRYCGEDNSGCDYNFAVTANGKTQRCTVVRMPGANAATESWSNEPCTDGSNLKISWGYATEPAPAFAVMTVVDGKELAWFGVSNVNEQEVTASNPFGSGSYGSLGAQQVYTY